MVLPSEARSAALVCPHRAGDINEADTGANLGSKVFPHFAMDARAVVSVVRAGPLRSKSVN
jgi:hypothetical protein